MVWIALLAAGLAGADPVPELERLRSLYLEAVVEADRIEDGLSLVDALRGHERVAETLLLAYEGALVTLRAKHARWPHRKLSHLREGLVLLDDAVELAPDDAEIRYLRLLSCYYLPGILGRKGSVEEDFRALARQLPLASRRFPPDLYQDMIRFVLDRGSPTAGERETLESALHGPE